MEEERIENSQIIDFNATIEDAKKIVQEGDFLFARDDEEEFESDSYTFNLNPTAKDVKDNVCALAPWAKDDPITQDWEQDKQSGKCFKIDLNAKVEDDEPITQEWQFESQTEKCFQIDLNAKIEDTKTQDETFNFGNGMKSIDINAQLEDDNFQEEPLESSMFKIDLNAKVEDVLEPKTQDEFSYENSNTFNFNFSALKGNEDK